MTIDWNHILTGTIGLAIGVFLKTLLDFNIAIYIIRWFHWLPVRWLFRTSPNVVSGLWEQIWNFESTSSFPKDIDRHSNVTIRQLGVFCYGEFHSKGKTYCIYAQTRENFIYGSWFDKKDKLGYFGTFELRVIDSNNMEGKWIGHSKTKQDIFGDTWIWKKIEN